MTRASPATHAVSNYDEVPYLSLPVAQTHPSRLAAIGRLFGLDTPRASHSRVLELGCASGGNIVPLAEAFPHATFVGIDTSARQIQDGAALIEVLGLSNITLRHQSILDLPPDEPYDYIICHGVFSWVPTPVQEAILALGATHLSSNGLLFVSYNTLPGWHMRGIIRDMMLYHARKFATPHKRLSQAGALLKFVSEAASHRTTPYAMLLKEELQTLSQQPKSYVLHDHLEDCNDALYFSDFVDRAAHHDLQFVAEAEVHAMATGNLGKHVADTLRRIAHSVVEREQYMDFVRNRTFRQTLLARSSLRVDHKLRADRLTGLHLSSMLRRPDPIEPGVFIGPHNIRVHVGPTGTNAALNILAERWPAPMLFEDLISASAVGHSEHDDYSSIGNDLLRFFAAGLVDVWDHPLQVASGPTPTPRASRLARSQAINGSPVATLTHQVATLTRREAQLLALLDGTRDVGQIAKALGTGEPKDTMSCDEIAATVARFKEIHLLMP